MTQLRKGEKQRKIFEERGDDLGYVRGVGRLEL